MKIFKLLALLSLPVASILATPQAYADSYGPLSVTVWNGTYSSGVTDIASSTLPTAAALATFTYNGPINWVNNDSDNSHNTFANFFGSEASDISNFSSTDSESTFLGLLMSNPGETGGSINTFIKITGTMYGDGSVSIGSDDGSCLYLSGVAVSGLCHPNPQTNNTYSAAVNAGAGTPFQLDYVESNGAPSDLVVTGASPSAAPEPESLTLVGTGLLGLAGLVRRRFAR